MNEYHLALGQKNHKKTQMAFFYADDHSDSASNNKTMFYHFCLGIYCHLQKYIEY